MNAPGPHSPVRVSVRYADTWEDGFGARGWKLDLPNLGSDIIAATPYTGDLIPTSVFVHDIVDHLLCGFSLTGYIDEAAALIQLSLRTGSDPLSDYQQMIDEDLLPGLCQHDDWIDLLPESLARQAKDSTRPGAGLEELRRRLGDGVLRALLLSGFVREGWQRVDVGRAHWEGLGLRYGERGKTALALQELFEQMDATVLERRWEHAAGQFVIHREEVAFQFLEPAPSDHHSVSISPP